MLNKVLNSYGDTKTKFIHLKNNVCPASIVLTLNSNGYSMVYIGRHFGHELNPSILRISKDAQTKLVNLISNHVDEDYILGKSQQIAGLKFISNIRTNFCENHQKVNL